jgi:hypothetical protein
MFVFSTGRGRPPAAKSTAALTAGAIADKPYVVYHQTSPICGLFPAAAAAFSRQTAAPLRFPDSRWSRRTICVAPVAIAQREWSVQKTSLCVLFYGIKWNFSHTTSFFAQILLENGKINRNHYY